jgi:small-conductance mechanosensitive channel
MEVLRSATDLACADPDWADDVIGRAEVLGIQELGSHQITVRVQVWVVPGAKRPFQRHLRLCLQEGLDSAGLGSPNPTYDVWLKSDAEQPAPTG